MQYHLNFNYGKVTVDNQNKDYVTVINPQGKTVNLMFGGELDIKHATVGYRTYFFGSSGYRKPIDSSWTYVKGVLLCQVIEGRAFMLTKFGMPIDTDKPRIQKSNQSSSVINIKRYKD